MGEDEKEKEDRLFIEALQEAIERPPLQTSKELLPTEPRYHDAIVPAGEKALLAALEHAILLDADEEADTVDEGDNDDD